MCNTHKLDYSGSDCERCGEKLDSHHRRIGSRDIMEFWCQQDLYDESLREVDEVLIETIKDWYNEKDKRNECN